MAGAGRIPHLPLWLQVTLGIIGALGGLGGAGGLALAIINRIQMGGAQNASAEVRLKRLEDWQQGKSVDRWEFDAHTKRLDELEADVRDVAALKNEVSRLIERADGREELMKERFKNLDHRINGVLQILEGHFGKPARPSAAVVRDAS